MKQTRSYADYHTNFFHYAKKVIVDFHYKQFPEALETQAKAMADSLCVLAIVSARADLVTPGDKIKYKTDYEYILLRQKAVRATLRKLHNNKKPDEKKKNKINMQRKFTRKEQVRVDQFCANIPGFKFVNPSAYKPDLLIP